MPTQITQLDDEENGRSILRVEGQLLRGDAELLGRIATDLINSSGREIVLDLADVDFIDSEAASVLKHLQFSNIFEITGVEILLQNAVNEVERHDLE
jgi:anti-anti-sigma regulatory factor